MEAISIQPGGAWFAARWFSALPLIVLGVAWIVLRLQGHSGFWWGGRLGWLLLLLLLFAYYAAIWNWLFRDQFYGLVPTAESEWRLSYRMPAREASVDPRQIVRIRGENLGSITGGATTGRVVIELADGSRLRSAQVARHRIPGYIAVLQSLLPGTAQSP